MDQFVHLQSTKKARVFVGSGVPAILSRIKITSREWPSQWFSLKLFALICTVVTRSLSWVVHMHFLYVRYLLRAIAAVTICKYCPTLLPLREHVWRQLFHHLALSFTLTPTTTTTCSDDVSYPSSRPRNPCTPPRRMCASDSRHAYRACIYTGIPVPPTPVRVLYLYRTCNSLSLSRCSSRMMLSTHGMIPIKCTWYIQTACFPPLDERPSKQRMEQQAPSISCAGGAMIAASVDSSKRGEYCNNNGHANTHTATPWRIHESRCCPYTRVERQRSSLVNWYLVRTYRYNTVRAVDLSTHNQTLLKTAVLLSYRYVLDYRGFRQNFSAFLI